MSRIRTIKPSFWEDEKISKLSIPCRLFFIGTWNLADDLGVIRANPVLLKSAIFPYEENLRVSEVQKWIDALVDARMLIPISYKNESYYVIRTFRSHQKFDARYPNYIIPKEVTIGILDNYNNPTCTQREPNENPTREGEREEGMGEEEIPPNGGTKKTAPDVATRKEEFYNSLVPFIGKYPKEMIRKFYDYWTELNRSGNKMHFELQKTWELSKRLATWSSKDIPKNTSNFANHSNNQSYEQF